MVFRISMQRFNWLIMDIIIGILLFLMKVDMETVSVLKQVIITTILPHMVLTEVRGLALVEHL